MNARAVGDQYSSAGALPSEKGESEQAGAVPVRQSNLMAEHPYGGKETQAPGQDRSAHTSPSPGRSSLSPGG